MAFKMQGFSGFKQAEAKADPNHPSVVASAEQAAYEEAKKNELARLRSKRNPNLHSPHTYYYGDNPDDWREETQISDDPSEWGWENEPEYVTKYTVVHGGHKTEKVINPWGPLATSEMPKVTKLEKALGLTDDLTNPSPDWRGKAYLKHEGKD